MSQYGMGGKTEKLDYIRCLIENKLMSGTLIDHTGAIYIQP